MYSRYATPEERALAILISLPSLALAAIKWRLPSLPGISTKRLGAWRYVNVGAYRFALQIKKV